MTVQERVTADYQTMNLTTGPHPMKLLRDRLPDIWRASDLVKAKHGSTIQIAGNVICRQRPGTAKGFVFVSLEDETGVSNAIVDPDLFERYRLLITEEDFLVIEGEVQNSENVVLIKTHAIKTAASPARSCYSPARSRCSASGGVAGGWRASRERVTRFSLMEGRPPCRPN